MLPNKAVKRNNAKSNFTSIVTSRVGHYIPKHTRDHVVRDTRSAHFKLGYVSPAKDMYQTTNQFLSDRSPPV